MKKDIVITAATAKGYIELYKLYMEPLQGVKFFKWMIKMIPCTLATAILIATTICIPNFPALISLSFFAIPTFKAIKSLNEEEKKEREELKQLYPYLDITVKEKELQKLLIKYELLKEKDYTYYFDEKALERKEYIEKCDRVLNEMKRDYNISFSSDVPKVEIPKQKKIGVIKR